MKKKPTLFIYIVLLLFTIQSKAQDSLQVTVPKDSLKVPKSKWELKNKSNVELSEIAFVNWNAGGTSSISALGSLESSIIYTDGMFKWRNKGALKYGVNKQENIDELRKTEDLIELNSSVGYRTDSTTNWFYSAKLNFKTQFSNGYDYPNTSEPISRFMAPGYLFIGGGVEYGKNIDKFSVYMSPLTVKATFVLDEKLSREGAFGVEPGIVTPDGTVVREGERLREEVGILVSNNYETEVMDNINVKNAISLYSDYLNDFGNVDVDWEVIFDFRVNHFVKASLGSHLKYDNDIKVGDRLANSETRNKMPGAKAQWKQILGIGVELVF